MTDLHLLEEHSQALAVFLENPRPNTLIMLDHHLDLSPFTVDELTVLRSTSARLDFEGLSDHFGGAEQTAIIHPGNFLGVLLMKDLFHNVTVVLPEPLKEKKNAWLKEMGRRIDPCGGYIRGDQLHIFQKTIKLAWSLEDVDVEGDAWIDVCSDYLYDYEKGDLWQCPESLMGRLQAFECGKVSIIRSAFNGYVPPWQANLAGRLAKQVESDFRDPLSDVLPPITSGEKDKAALRKWYERYIDYLSGSSSDEISIGNYPSFLDFLLKLHLNGIRQLALHEIKPVSDLEIELSSLSVAMYFKSLGDWERCLQAALCETVSDQRRAKAAALALEACAHLENERLLQVLDHFEQLGVSGPRYARVALAACLRLGDLGRVRKYLSITLEAFPADRVYEHLKAVLEPGAMSQVVPALNERGTRV